MNALLEGDVARVGVFGLGRKPDLNKVRRRTSLAGVELSPGKRLPASPVFFDVTNGLSAVDVRREMKRLVGEGIGAVSVAEAFSPDDDRNEQTVVQIAREAGLPACASTELIGPLRPRVAGGDRCTQRVDPSHRSSHRAICRARVRDANITAPVMVMRGDGGATSLSGFREAPAKTLYSGPLLGCRCPAIGRHHRWGHRRSGRYLHERRRDSRRPAAVVVCDRRVACDRVTRP